MHSEEVTVTREELYEQVWKTPISRLACQFGISDVALAKICKKLAVPIPGRGYWARVTSGQKLNQPKLPKVRADTRTEFTMSSREPRPPKEKVDVPEIRVSDSLAGAHAVVRRLSGFFDGREPGRQKTLYLRGDSEATVRLGEQTKRRALLILDALFKALEERSHAVTFTVPRDAWSPHNLEVKVGSEAVKLFIAEPTLRADHKLTPKEEADQRRYGRAFAPTHDFNLSGKLRLRARAYYAIEKKWADGSTQRLEDVLGSVVIGIEEIAKRAAVKRTGAEERERLRQDEEHQRQARQVLYNYQRALGRELEEAAEDLRRATAIRELVAAVQQAAVPEGKGQAVEEWLAWAAGCAKQLDPRTNPVGAARLMRPNIGAMSDAEFRFWLEWPKSEEKITEYSPGFEPHGV